MKTLDVGPWTIGTTDSFERAFDIAFSTEVLEQAHGGPVSATPWTPTGDRIERTLRITSPLPDGFPYALKRFVAGDSFRMTVRQLGRLQSDDRRVRATVENKTHFHVPCARLLRTKSTFALSWDRANGRASMRASANIAAWLPPPLKSLAESFVVSTVRKNLDVYFRAVANIMSRDQVR